MKHCVHCGAELKPASLFCSKCGIKIDSANYTTEINTQNLASSSRRLINMIVDNFFGVNLFTFVLLFVFAFINGAEGTQEDSWFFLGLLSSFLYFFLCEYFGGRTLGKLLTGTKVVMEDGSKLTGSAALTRTLVRFVPFEAFTFFGDKPRGWHDTWSKTKVIRI